MTSIRMTSPRALHRIWGMSTTKPEPGAEPKPASKPASTSSIKDAPPLPPEEPDAFACCGNDCGEACVWSIYQYEQKLHAAALDAWHARQRIQGDDTARLQDD